MPDPLSINVQHLKASETVAISNEAKRRKAAGEDVLDLGVGEPDFDTPAPASQAGIQAIQRGMTRYPPNVGLADLRAGIAQQLSVMSSGRAVNPDNIIVSSGSKQSIFNACFSLFGPKDRVLIPSPAWVSYPQIVHLTRAEPVLVPGDPDWGLKVSVRDLDRLRRDLSPDQLRPRTRALAARLAGRAARANCHHLWCEQGLRDDRLADRSGARPASSYEGNGRFAVAHHHRRKPSRAVGRRGCLYG